MIYYTLAPKKNVLQPEMPVRYYAIAVSRGTTDLRSIAESISQRSSVSTIDTMAVIEGLLKQIPEELAAGRIVKLGEFGSFSLSITSEGTVSPDEFKPNRISGTKIHFRPGKVFRDKMTEFCFKKNN